MSIIGSSNGSIQTASSGSTFVTLPTQYCRVVHIFNASGADLEVRQDGAGVAVPVFEGVSFTFRGLSNLNQLSIRRRDQANTPVTVIYRWEYI